MGNKTRKRPALRRLATFVAALGMLTMSSGLVLMSTASANTNHEDHWETAPGEVCTKTDVGAQSGAYVVPNPPDGFQWTKLIIKKGAGNIGVENQVFNNPVAGVGYTWVGFNPQQSGGWSHTILCYVPESEPDPELATASIAVQQPNCENNNIAQIFAFGNNVEFPFDLDGTVAPGETVTVTATAVDGAEFEGGSTTKVFEDVVFNEAEEDCDEVLPPEEVTPVAPEFADPTCESGPAVFLPEPSEVDEDDVPPVVDLVKVAAIGITDVDGVRYEVTGDLVPGGTVEVTASAIEPNVLADGVQTFWTHTFADPENCDEVLPPAVLPPEVTPTVTPTVVAAGLPAADLRGEQGLALLVAGMVLMVVAGGLGVVRPSGAVRS